MSLAQTRLRQLQTRRAEHDCPYRGETASTAYGSQRLVSCDTRRMSVQRASSADRAVDEFLTAATSRPSALVIEGQAGIGKTTLWLSALDRAHERGFTVLTARASETEAVLAYATVGDLVAGIDPTLLAVSLTCSTRR